jgi:hypothetical protein
MKIRPVRAELSRTDGQTDLITLFAIWRTGLIKENKHSQLQRPIMLQSTKFGKFDCADGLCIYPQTMQTLRETLFVIHKLPNLSTGWKFEVMYV